MRGFELLEGLLKEKADIRLRRNVPLNRYSSFRIGGKADLFLEAGSTSALSFAVAAARRAGIPYYVIGSGTNILFDDRGYRGLIIQNSARNIRSGADGESLEIESGAPLARILQWAAKNDLAGLEFLAGIPGTAGGAFYSNAGAFGRCIAEVVEYGEVLDPQGKQVRIPRDAFSFGYRFSVLQENRTILLGAALRLVKGEGKSIRAAAKGHILERRAKHPPWGTACAGSYFKNPLGEAGGRVPAGRLLEKSGARGLKVGDAAVSEKHCNFIINLGRATSADVRRLAEELRDKVFRTCGILLEEEVIFLREDASMP
jgi:UDP-N-acetylmuramate dehydrogenase